MKACFAEQMRKIDSAAVTNGGIPSIVLMENAALACVNELKHDFCDLKSRRVGIFCGKGNNGGDGFAIARHLYNEGVDVSVFLVCGTEFSGDAEINFNIIRKMDVAIEIVTDTENLKYIIKSFDIVIDAIYGTGIRGTLQGITAEVIDEINHNAEYVLSVDIPSGINADSGEICGTCIKADKTVTFAAYKMGMLMFPGADYIGSVTVSDISIPQYIIDECETAAVVPDINFVKGIIPKRKNNSHKGDYGKLLIVAGSKGMTGAAYMAATAAVRVGCGLVTLGICESLNSVMEEKTTEVMTLPLPDINGHLSESASEKILGVINNYDAVLIGPGLGRSGGVFSVVRSVLVNSKVPVIVDADAINVLSQDMSVLSNCNCNLIFTPHSMEMSRLTGLDVSYVDNNRLTVSKEFSEEYGATIILKGHHTVVTTPELMQYINITGNSGLAKGGSGDVLAGIVAALLACGIDEAYSAAAAVYIHGLAADIAVKEKNISSLLATDVIKSIPKVMKMIMGE